MALQKPLRGLAQFIGLYRQGQVELDFNQVLQPVLEMDDYLSPNKWQLFRQTLAPNANLEIVVPESKFWRLKFVSAHVATPAVTSHRLFIHLVKTVNAVEYKIPLQGIVQQLSGNATYTVDQNSQAGFGYVVTGVNAEAGDKVMLDLDATIGVGNTVATLFVQYQELDI